MDHRNQTVLKNCRFLNDQYFEKLFHAFNAAFSDYVIPFALTEAQFRNHIRLNAVDLVRSVGCIEDDRLVGFSLNGFGDWQKRSTVYDAGTGVVPDRRRQGVSEAMFEMMLPAFAENGVQQCLLEVVTTNTAAINLYEKLGFHIVRELALLQSDPAAAVPVEMPPGIDVREIMEPDWGLYMTFWDGKPSWQNSVDAINRSHKMKRILGAFLDEKCVGYIVFSSKFGRIAQLAVDKEYRNQGIGTFLVRSMLAETAEGYSMQVINIDKSIVSAMEFFKKRGFYERLSQNEMLMSM